MQYDKHKKACEVFAEIDKNPENYLIIHYSCESFYDIGDGHKAEYYIRQHQDNIAIAKFKTNQPLTEIDVETLEAILWKEVGTKLGYEHEISTKPLGEFVREIVGLDMNAAKEAFSEYLTSTSLLI